MRADKLIKDSESAGHHQPDWETMNCCKGRKMDWRQPECPIPPATNKLQTAEEPDATSQTGRQINSYKGTQISYIQTAEEPDTTNQIGTQMNSYRE